MSEGELQFKITYNTTDYQTLYDYGTDLLSKYANCIVNANQLSDCHFSYLIIIQR